MDKIYLTCHGLDTIGQVFLNGFLLGPTDNVFVRYMWPVKSFLKPEANFLQIRFISAPEYSRQYYIKTMLEKYIIPPGNKLLFCPLSFTQLMVVHWSHN